MALTQVSTGGIKDGQVHTADLADAQITAGKLHADALDRTYTLGADGSNHYTFTGEGLTGAVNDPTLYLTRGKTYRFVNGNSGGAHPFRIQTTVNGSAGTEYNTGVTNNGGAGGSTIIFEVPHAAPDVLYYQCTSHGSMGGIFYITGALADDGVTTAKLADDAVTTAKIADDAVTTAKVATGAITNTEIATGTISASRITSGGITSSVIANDAIITDRIADNAVTTSKIADQAITLAKLPHGTSSNDGKFLRANNGADPTFETLTIPVGIPSGGIIMWSGAENAIPSGFVLCDGNNSTPDLRNRFIVGAGTGGNYGVGNTGGADSVTLTVSQIPPHTHSMNWVDFSGQTKGYRKGSNYGNINTNSTGGGAAHENRPPFYALCFIMKT